MSDTSLLTAMGGTLVTTPVETEPVQTRTSGWTDFFQDLTKTAAVAVVTAQVNKTAQKNATAAAETAKANTQVSATQQAVATYSTNQTLLIGGAVVAGLVLLLIVSRRN